VKTDDLGDPGAHWEHIRAQLALMTFSPPRRDDSGHLLPLQSYEETVNASMDFIFTKLDDWFQGDPQTLIDEAGIKRPVYFYYANLAMDGQVFRGAGDNHVSYPAFHHSLYIKAFLAWYAIRNDARALQAAVDLAVWNLAHSTPLDWAYGGMPYSTFNKGRAGGFVDGASIMTDKAAIMALAYLGLFKATNDGKYRAAAEQIGKTLAAKQLPEGNWPFRVNPQTEEVTEAYTSSAIYGVKLFEALDALSGDRRYAANRDAALDWILENPVKTGKWCGYYEDIPAKADNRTNWDCIDTVRYLLKRRDEKPAYLDVALELVKYLNETPIQEGKTFLNTGHPYMPAEGVREQKACFVTMGVHSAHWAVMMAELSLATGDAEYKRRAVQTMNFVTYHLQPDGRILVGLDHPHESGGFAFNQYWFSCHMGTALMLIDFLKILPEIADLGVSVRQLRSS
jgi:uncharacterized protein YyaL (SSP411 family)